MGQFSKTYFLRDKNAFGKYLSYATPGGYVACFGTKVFKFPWRVIFGRFLPEDEQKPKQVSAQPQIPLWYEKCVTEWNSTFCKIVLHYGIMIFQTMSPTRRRTYNCHHSLQKIFDPIPLRHALNFFTNQEAQLGFLLVLWYVLLPHPFHTQKCPYRSQLYVMQLKFKFLVFNR